MPNRFSARTRKIYSWPGISFPILQEVFVTEANPVTSADVTLLHYVIGDVTASILQGDVP